MDKDDEKKFKVRRFGFRIIKEGDKPPKIEYIDDFDNNDAEVFEKEFENMFRRIHQMQMEMLRMFGIEPVKIVERVKEENDYEEETTNLPMFDASREGDKLKISVLLGSSKDVDAKIEDGKLVIVGDDINIRVPLNSDFKNGKIKSKEVKNGILNLVIER